MIQRKLVAAVLGIWLGIAPLLAIAQDHKYDLFMRAYGPWAVLMWMPAALGVIAASWLVGRRT